MPAKLLPGPLTAQIARDSFVRRLIDASFPTLALISRARNQRLKAAGFGTLPKTHEYGVVGMLAGTAIDYRIRAYFCRDFHQSPLILRGTSFFGRLSKKRSQLAVLLKSLNRFIARVKPKGRKLAARSEEKLCRYAVVLAYLDVIWRSSFGSSAVDVLASILRPTAEKSLRQVDSVLVSDVVDLSKRFYEGHALTVRKARRVVAGGELRGSSDIGGADFDLLVDGCLMDFKATREAKVTTRTLQQLAGYWLLDYDDEYKIRSFAVSLLRHGCIEYFDIERDLLVAGNFGALRSAFRLELSRAKKSA